MHINDWDGLGYGAGGGEGLDCRNMLERLDQIFFYVVLLIVLKHHLSRDFYIIKLPSIFQKDAPFPGRIRKN